MKTLIFGTSYIAGQQSRYVFGLWLNLVQKLNPDSDILVVDSASPDMPGFLGRVKYLQLGDNIGHLGHGGQDGWGRAFCAGLQHAIDHGYDSVVHIETDLLFARPVGEIMDKMSRSRVLAAAPVAAPFQFIETALMFLSVGYVQSINLIGKYDWHKAEQTPFPEVRIERIIQERLFSLPLKGLRNDLDLLTVKNMAGMFPDGVDWLTHCRDPAVYREFLRVNEHG